LRVELDVTTLLLLLGCQALREGPVAVEEIVAILGLGQLREACGVLEGLVVAAEAMSTSTYMVLSDARRRAHEARRRAEAAAGLPVSDW
jgi:hypothetical protein